MCAELGLPVLYPAVAVSPLTLAAATQQGHGGRCSVAGRSRQGGPGRLRLTESDLPGSEINDRLLAIISPTNRLHFLYRPFPLGTSDPLGWEAQLFTVVLLRFVLGGGAEAARPGST